MRPFMEILRSLGVIVKGGEEKGGIDSGNERQRSNVASYKVVVDVGPGDNPVQLSNTVQRVR